MVWFVPLGTNTHTFFQSYRLRSSLLGQYLLASAVANTVECLWHTRVFNLAGGRVLVCWTRPPEVARSASADELVRLGGRRPGGHLVEHRVVDVAVGRALQAVERLHVDVVDQPAATLVRDAHRDVVVEALQVPVAGGVVPHVDELQEDPAVAERTDGVGRRAGIVGHAVGDDDGVRRHLHELDRGLGATAAPEHAATTAEQVAVAGDLGQLMQRRREVRAAARLDAVLLEVPVEVAGVDGVRLDTAVEEHRRHVAVVVHDERETESDVDRVLDRAAVVLVAHRATPVHHGHHLPLLVGVDLVGHEGLRRGVHLLGQETAGAVLGIRIGSFLLDGLQVRHVVVLLLVVEDR